MITLLPGVPDMCFCQKITVPTCMVAIWAIFKILYVEHFFYCIGEVFILTHCLAKCHCDVFLSTHPSTSKNAKH